MSPPPSTGLLLSPFPLEGVVTIKQSRTEDFTETAAQQQLQMKSFLQIIVNCPRKRSFMQYYTLNILYAKFIVLAMKQSAELFSGLLSPMNIKLEGELESMERIDLKSDSTILLFPATTEKRLEEEQKSYSESPIFFACAFFCLQRFRKPVIFFVVKRLS